MDTIYLKIDTSDDAVVGGGWQGLDSGASVSKYLNLITAAVQEKFPGYEVEIEETNHRTEAMFEDDRDGSDSYQEIGEDETSVIRIVEQVWQGQDWYVEPQMIDLAGAAAIARCNASTLRYAIKRGDLTGQKFGKTWVVTRDDLQAWIDNPLMHKRGARAK